MEVRSNPFESAKSHFFDTSSWGEFCDVTLTLKQALQPDRGGWAKIDDYRCRQAFRHFMNLLNRAVYGSAFRRHGKRLRVLPVLEKGEVRAGALRPWEPRCGVSRRVVCRDDADRQDLHIICQQLARGQFAHSVGLRGSLALPLNRRKSCLAARELSLRQAAGWWHINAVRCIFRNLITQHVLMENPSGRAEAVRLPSVFASVSRTRLRSMSLMGEPTSHRARRRRDAPEI